MANAAARPRLDTFQALARDWRLPACASTPPIFLFTAHAHCCHCLAHIDGRRQARAVQARDGSTLPTFPYKTAFVSCATPLAVRLSLLLTCAALNDLSHAFPAAPAGALRFCKRQAHKNAVISLC